MVEVTAMDDDTPGLTDTQLVTVNVTNVNEPPYFNDQMLSFTIDEFTTDITIVQAIDEDGDTLTYSIPDISSQDIFGIDAMTGALAFINNPGEDSTYDVQIKADDGEFSTYQDITVTVEVGGFES